MTSELRGEYAARPHWVYELLAEDGTPLYIGCTVDIAARLGQHRGGKDWYGEVSTIEVHKFPNQRSALDAERELIEAQQPKHNTVHTDKYLAGGTGRLELREAIHATGALCEFGGCRRCKEKRHDLGYQCDYSGCGRCPDAIPYECLDDEVALACWRELQRRHDARYATAMFHASRTPLDALEADELDLTPDDLADIEDLGDLAAAASIVTRARSGAA